MSEILNIAKRVAVATKLNEEEKFNKFFLFILKEQEVQIKKIKANQQAFIIQHEIDVDDIKSQLEDAKQRLADSYLSVSIENVQNNESISKYAETYLGNIVIIQGKIVQLERRLKEKEEHKIHTLEDFEERIKFRQDIISKLTEKE